MNRDGWLLALAVGVALGSVAGLANAQSDADVLGLTEPPWGGWHTEQIDPHGRPGNVAFTSEGEPRVAYTQGFEGTRVAEPTVTGWDAVVIEKMSSPGSLAIDADDREWVGYSRGHAEPPFHKVKIAWSEAGSEDWTIETVDEGLDVAMALGGDGQPRVLYSDDRNEQSLLLYAERTGPEAYTIDVVETADEHVMNFWKPQLTAAPDGSLHAVFWQLRGGEALARYGAYDPGTEQWSFTWLDACWTSTDPAIDVAPDGWVHVACHKGKGLIHYTKDPTTGEWSWQVAATGWDVVPTRFNENMGQEPSIAASEDAVHFSWRTSFNPGFPDDPTAPAHLYYTSYVEGTYTTEPVDTQGTGIGRDSAIALDGNDRPWILYMAMWRVNSAPMMDPVNSMFSTDIAHPTVALADT